ncbi:hypothetical protein V1512DRAFT_257360 [Lipomyces arxii]|uniref:uncharacterized protein n=1 Tax=Lipomyces arxii TaxID=56418 RepID=UPI0034CDF230
MNWVGGQLSNTSNRIGVHKNKSAFDSEDRLAGSGKKRASTLARNRRQQRQHFQNYKRTQKTSLWKIRKCDTSGITGFDRSAKTDNSNAVVNYSINQVVSQHSSISPPVRPREAIQLDVPNDESSIIHAESSISELKQKLLNESDWSALFLIDPTKGKQAHESLSLDSDNLNEQFQFQFQPDRTKKIRQPDTQDLLSSPFKLSFKTPLSPISMHSTSSLESPLRGRKLKFGRALLPNVQMEKTSEREYLQRIGGDDTVVSECSIQPISQNSFNIGHEGEQVETSFEILDASESYDDRDSWRKTLMSKASDEETKNTSVAKANDYEVDTVVAREWEELIGYKGENPESNLEHENSAMISPKWSPIRMTKRNNTFEWQDLCESSGSEQ